MREERLYHVWVVNDKKGRETRLMGYAMTHAKCCIFKAAQTPYREARYELREVIKGN